MTETEHLIVVTDTERTCAARNLAVSQGKMLAVFGLLAKSSGLPVGRAALTPTDG